MTLLDEYHDWFPGTKIELVNGQLIIGNSLIHSRRLLQQILHVGIATVWQEELGAIAGRLHESESDRAAVE
ncbi:MAG: hypothetical protein MUF49_27305 [Oculatellaceae cyanobacterium Prado106]|nr:hypothetical protein [Oculatellaceae cyanobacterium Prado106]